MTVSLVCEKEQATAKTNAAVLRCAQNDKRFLWFAHRQRATAGAVRLLVDWKRKTTGKASAMTIKANRELKKRREGKPLFFGPGGWGQCC
jgi:hypothetical protein